jgi:hypothetical protein
MFEIPPVLEICNHIDVSALRALTSMFDFRYPDFAR